ncbi:MAG TPA: hypothetical protein VK430_05390 [Xanthobacteraceae bacterium]|nr:hypothetical protein [Xanthobacteraceae bacterium]
MFPFYPVAHWVAKYLLARRRLIAAWDMADERKTDPLEKLQEARRLAVEARRKLADALAEGHRGPVSDNTRRHFVEAQAAIEAIDRAIADENKLGKRPTKGGNDALQAKK